jgi:diadenosine tetraphosphatase ApaH/serine/threonine PP2A family protein phosphatase
MWTRKTVTAALKEFLRSLRREVRFETDGKRYRLVHGSPRRMNEYLFEDRPLSSFQRLAATSEADVLIFGHTHKPYTKRVDGVLFINAGSVGKPKDGDPRACYVVLGFTQEPLEITGVRAAQAGRRNGSLAAILAVGFGSAKAARIRTDSCRDRGCATYGRKSMLRWSRIRSRTRPIPQPAPR